MRIFIGIIGIMLLAFTTVANAAGWAHVHEHVHPSGKCGGSPEVLVSYYAPTGRLTSSGESYFGHGLTAASCKYKRGTVVTLQNPYTNKACHIRINDTLPCHGAAVKAGDVFDLTIQSHECLFGRSRDTRYACLTSIDANGNQQFAVRQNRRQRHVSK